MEASPLPSQLRVRPPPQLPVKASESIITSSTGLWVFSSRPYCSSTSRALWVWDLEGQKTRRPPPPSAPPQLQQGPLAQSPGADLGQVPPKQSPRPTGKLGSSSASQKGRR